MASLEEFQTWSVNALKAFLNVRGKNTDGTFNELAARAFVSSSQNEPVDPDKEHEERALLEEYKQNLIITGGNIPDPLSIKTGWVGEKNGITKWPHLIYNDIAEYLRLLRPEFICQLEREYKLGKAYRYFKCEFVREVFYHPIEDYSKFCLLRCRVVPSQRTSNKAYTVWVCLTKDIDENPGGQIHAAYCTCTAGLKGACNHVAALLFRVDNAVITGQTKPSKTSKLCQWKVPSGAKVNVEPTEVSEMIFHQSKYTSTTERDFAKEKQEYLLFSPTLYDEHLNEIQDKHLLRKEVYFKIKGEIKNSRFAEIMEKRPLNRVEESHYDLPNTTEKNIKNFHFDENASLEENVCKFTESIKVTKNQITDVKRATSDQNINTLWGEYRQGRITASNFQKVYTKVNTININTADKPCETKPLVDTILGNAKFVETKSMKHDKALEPHALRMYTSKMVSSRKHKSFSVTHSGIVLLEAHPFIGASPDMEISCDCCGKEVGEIKCPYSVCDQIPSPDNLSYLEWIELDTGEKIGKLKENHSYFFQIQGQIAITDTKYCDFFVYTKHGHHLERITWEKVLKNLIFFWTKFVFPALIENKRTAESEEFTVSSEKSVSPNHGISFQINPPTLIKSQTQHKKTPKSKRKSINKVGKKPKKVKFVE